MSANFPPTRKKKSSESVRVNLTVSKEVHAYLEARAKLTGSTVAGTAAHIVEAAMIAECDRVLKVSTTNEVTD